MNEYLDVFDFTAPTRMLKPLQDLFDAMYDAGIFVGAAGCTPVAVCNAMEALAANGGDAIMLHDEHRPLKVWSGEPAMTRALKYLVEAAFEMELESAETDAAVAVLASIGVSVTYPQHVQAAFAA